MQNKKKRDKFMFNVDIVFMPLLFEDAIITQGGGGWGGGARNVETLHRRQYV